MPRHYVKITAIIVLDEKNDTAILRSALQRNAHAVVDDAMDRIEAVYPDCAIGVSSQLA